MITTLKHFQKIARETPDLPLEDLSQQHVVAKQRDHDSVSKIFIAFSKAHESYFERFLDLFNL